MKLFGLMQFNPKPWKTVYESRFDADLLVGYFQFHGKL